MMNRPAPQQPHPAQIAQEFLTRTNLKGGEVDTYAQTFNWLQAIVAGELTVQPIADIQASQKRIEELEGRVEALEAFVGPETVKTIFEEEEEDSSEKCLEHVE